MHAAATAPGPRSRFVEDVRVLTPAAEGIGYERFPDGRTTLVFRTFDGGQRGDLCAMGPYTRALFKSARGAGRAVILTLKPGWAAAALGIPPAALRDRITPLELLWGRAGSELCEQLLAGLDVASAVERLERELDARAQRSEEASSARLARRAVKLIEDGETRLEEVAAQLGVTPRHVRRAFTESIGVGPKEFARGARLRRAVRMTATSMDWAAIARSAGYYDQAHLITDFRELVGVTPSMFMKRGGRAQATGRPAPLPSATPVG